jgi:hypothetical protein
MVSSHGLRRLELPAGTYLEGGDERAGLGFKAGTPGCYSPRITRSPVCASRLIRIRSSLA